MLYIIFHTVQLPQGACHGSQTRAGVVKGNNPKKNKAPLEVNQVGGKDEG